MKIDYNSPVILTYSFLSFLVLLTGYFLSDLITKYFFSVFWTSFLDPLMYFRIFSHILGHINLTHYVTNFGMILLLGPMLEEKYGSNKLLFMILLTAFTTGILNVLLFDSALMGASGIVLMFILLSSFGNFKSGHIPLTFILIFILFLGKEIFDAFFISDDISQFGHIIGGICGSIYGYILDKKKIKNKYNVT